MIRIVKQALRKTLKRTCLGFEDLSTVLQEVEAGINARPLTYLGTEPADQMPLTPSHFLVGRRVTTLPNLREGVDLDSTTAALSRRIRARRKYLRDLWRRWKHNYLLQLRSAHHKGSSSTVSLKQGDVVLIEDDHPQLQWTLARIVRSTPGADGIHRLLTVSLPDRRQLQVPAQRLYLLEGATPAAG